jgi:hypothetical protein
VEGAQQQEVALEVLRATLHDALLLRVRWRAPVDPSRSPPRTRHTGAASSRQAVSDVDARRTSRHQALHGWPRQKRLAESSGHAVPAWPSAASKSPWAPTRATRAASFRHAATHERHAAREHQLKRRPIDERTTRHVGRNISSRHQRKGKCIEAMLRQGKADRPYPTRPDQLLSLAPPVRPMNEETMQNVRHDAMAVRSSNASHSSHCTLDDRHGANCHGPCRHYAVFFKSLLTKTTMDSKLPLLPGPSRLKAFASWP